MNKITPKNKTILDPCCGARMFWFDKNDERAVFGDIRNETKQLCDGRTLKFDQIELWTFVICPMLTIASSWLSLIRRIS